MEVLVPRLNVDVWKKIVKFVQEERPWKDFYENFSASHYDSLEALSKGARHSSFKATFGYAPPLHIPKRMGDLVCDVTFLIRGNEREVREGVDGFSLSFVGIAKHEPKYCETNKKEFLVYPDESGFCRASCTSISYPIPCICLNYTDPFVEVLTDLEVLAVEVTYVQLHGRERREIQFTMGCFGPNGLWGFRGGEVWYKPEWVGDYEICPAVVAMKRNTTPIRARDTYGWEEFCEESSERLYVSSLCHPTMPCQHQTNHGMKTFPEILEMLNDYEVRTTNLGAYLPMNGMSMSRQQILEHAREP